MYTVERQTIEQAMQKKTNDSTRLEWPCVPFIRNRLQARLQLNADLIFTK